MMKFADSFSKVFNFNWGVIKQDIENSKDKDFFPYTGTQVFCGRQGTGKTISMVYQLQKIMKKYPKAKVVSNLELNVEFPYIKVHDINELGNALSEVNNGKYGVIYAIDEIHTYFNALDSKNIPSYIFTQISQQRKQRKLIMGTSQLYLRMAKPFREQCDTLIMCRCLFNKFNICYVYDGASLEEDFGKLNGQLLKVGFFWQTPLLRDSYDTMQVITSGREEYQQNVNLKTSLEFKGKPFR